MTATITSGYQLSPQQRRLAALQAYGSAYNTCGLVSIVGPLRLECLQEAIERTVQRHEILRTHYIKPAGTTTPLQVIETSLNPEWSLVDLSDLAADRQDDVVIELYAREQIYTFDLKQGSLLRATLLRLSDSNAKLILALPAICADVRSLRILVEEIYRGYSGADAHADANVTLQYADVSEWLNEMASSEDATNQARELWSQCDLPFMPDRRTDHNAELPDNVAFDPAESTAEVAMPLFDLVRQQSEAFGVPVPTFLFSCWHALLSRVTGRYNSSVAYYSHGRQFEELETAFGPFAKWLPIACNDDPKLRFQAVLGHACEEINRAVDRHDVLSWDQRAPDADGSVGIAHFAFGFEFLEHDAIAEAGDVQFTLLRQHCRSERFHLLLSCRQTPHGLTIALIYDRVRYASDEADRLADQFLTLLYSALAEPNTPVDRLNILPARQRQQLLVDFNSAHFDITPTCVHQLFEQQVQRTPHALALQVEDQALTYAQLNARANQLAHWLTQQGVQADTVVGLYLNRSTDLIVGLLAILKAGAAYLPLDPAFPDERLAFLLSDSHAPLLLTHSSLTHNLGAYAGICLCLDTQWTQVSPHSHDDLPIPTTLDHLAYLIYTSGSTGVPKGVLIEHASLTHYVQALLARLQLPPHSRFASVSTLAADLGNTVVFGALCSGGCLHLIATQRAMDAGALGEYMQRERIDCLKIVPSHLSALLSGAQAQAVLPKRVLVLGGEACPWSLVDRVRALAPQCRVFNHYGPTETTVGVLTYAVTGAQTRVGANVPLGRGLGSTRVYVLDAQGQAVPMGVVGELYVGGVQVARGYLEQEALTAERFIANPFGALDAPRLYRTGDLVRWLEEGSLEFVGRADDQVKIRGYRVELGEIESVLRAHPGVREAVVVAIEDTAGVTRLSGFVVGAEGADLSVRALREYVGEFLPEYMMPSVIRILEMMPLTPNGKVDRSALPALGDPVHEETYVAPRTPVEEGLVEVWSELLSVERVGIHDNFFELGGHSLLAMQVMFRICDTFQVNVPIQALFESPTVATLAERIVVESGTWMTARPLIAQVPREGPIPLSYAQQRLWFIDQLEPNSPLYNIPIALRLTGILDRDALEHSLNELVRRHDLLRTVFVATDGEPIQVVRVYTPLDLAVNDLSTLGSDERDREAKHQIAREAQRPFSLAEGPLFRAGMLRLGDQEHILLLTLHHTLSDGWSRRVLMRELAALYNAFHAGKACELPDLPIQYRDYAVWQRQWLQGAALENQLAYWKDHLAGAPALLELPSDRPRPAVRTYQGARAHHALPEELSRAVKHLGHTQGATLFMSLLAAFQVLLYRYSGQDQIVVGTPIANRPQSELEGLIGFFMNTLALRGDLSGEPSFRQLLGRVRKAALGAYAHQDLPFEKLVEELQPERSMSRSPIFQVMFTLQTVDEADSRSTMTGLQITHADSERITAKSDLVFSVIERGGRLMIGLEYNTDLFDSDRMERLLEHFHTLLEAIVADPDLAISRLPMLTEVERHQLLVEWNDTAADYPSDRCLHQLFEEQVQRNPDAIALVCRDQRLSYQDLNARANRLARSLRQEGVGRGVLVGLCLARSLDMIVGLLGILKAGGAYLPLDPANPLGRLSTILDDAHPPVLLCDASSVQRLDGLPGRVLSLDAAALRSGDPSAGDLLCVTTAQDLAYVMFTSGSTGQPKGVEVPHRAVTRLVRGSNYCELGPDEVILQFAPLAFDASTFEIWGSLLNGGCLVLVEGQMTSLEELGEMIRREGVTTLWLTAGLFHAMVESNLEGLQGVRQLLAGGDVLSAPHVAQALQGLPGCRFINGYGPTENTTFTCCNRIAAGSEVTGSIPIGRPVSNTQVYVLDARMEPVPVGVAGELYAGGDGVARGYLNRSDLTAERFVPDPFSDAPGARLYRTGDQVRWRADGQLEFVGRIDHQVKIRGFRIELGEIESVLLAHPSVREAVVLAREDVAGDKRLVAYIVAAAGNDGPGMDLRGIMREHLPEYMLPSAFVWLQALPLAPNGKIDREALSAPDMVNSGLAREFVSPRTPIEEIVAEIWTEVLAVDNLSVTDNFFEIGGHSLIATRVLSRVYDRFQVEVPLRLLFLNPTLEAFSVRILQLLMAGSEDT